MQKRGKDLGKLQEVVGKLVSGEGLEPSYKPHPLVGNWKPKWDLHIQPDWLLIYEVTEDEVRLARTGTHADLFKK
jgi:mRNA interferase YafQ